VSDPKPPAPRDQARELLLEEAWSIIHAAKAEGNFAVASATLERAARIAGLWSEKPGPIDPAGPPVAQVFTSEPMTHEQWSEKFAPKDG
jgi:hypothetical protein